MNLERLSRVLGAGIAVASTQATRRNEDAVLACEEGTSSGRHAQTYGTRVQSREGFQWTTFQPRVR
jgi:hypothetical protein